MEGKVLYFLPFLHMFKPMVLMAKEVGMWRLEAKVLQMMNLTMSLELPWI